MSTKNDHLTEPVTTQTEVSPSIASNKEQAPEEKKSRKKWILIALLLLLLLGLGTCAVLNLPQEEPSPVAVMPDLDGNIEDITTREELESAMQEEADAAYFNLQVNPDAIFSAGTGEGSFELINPNNNVYPISFVITLDATGQEVYRSGTVPPNKQISTIILNPVPSSGTHDATVRVSIYNPDTQEKEGETLVKIKMSVTA